jgi:hypothetical protein
MRTETLTAVDGILVGTVHPEARWHDCRVVIAELTGSAATSLLG